MLTPALARLQIIDLALTSSSSDEGRVSLDLVTWEIMRAWVEQLEKCRSMLKQMFQQFDVNRDEVRHDILHTYMHAIQYICIYCSILRVSACAWVHARRCLVRVHVCFVYFISSVTSLVSVCPPCFPKAHALKRQSEARLDA
jgi:hypothetical protein